MDIAYLQAIGVYMPLQPSGGVCGDAKPSVDGRRARAKSERAKSEFMALCKGGSSSAVNLVTVPESDGFKTLILTLSAVEKGQKRVGLDFGGVVSIYGKGEDAKGEDTALVDTSDPMDRLTPGCLEAVGALVKHVGPQNMFIVSKAGKAMAEKSAKLLHEVDFFTKTGFLDDGQHVFFCTGRSMKREIVEELGITHFADDRWGILSQLPRKVSLCLFPSAADDGVTDCPPGDLLKRLKHGEVIVGQWSAFCAALGCHIDADDDRLRFCSKAKQWVPFSS